MTSFKSDTLRILSERGLLHQHTDLDHMDQMLAQGPVTAYCGFDPTATSLHIGNLIPMMMLYWLQQTGHKIITLMGGGTALIGDPSFKDASRPLMSEETIAQNIAGIKGIFARLLRYGDGPSDAIMVNNADWLKTIGYVEFLRDYGVHISVNRMLSFDSVRLRLEREQHLSFLEFNYSLMQAYDYVKLYKDYNCMLQISGADQWANAISGAELARKKEGVTLHVLTAPLLLDAAGNKMGKSEGNALWLNPELQSDYEYYQYWRNVDDAVVGKMLKLFTTLPIAEIEKLSALQDAEINEAKKILAFEATKMIRGEEAAQIAAQTAQQTFAGSGKSEGLPKLFLQSGEENDTLVIDLIVRAGLAPSKGEARRLIQGNGIRVNDQPVTQENALIQANQFDGENTLKLSAGKKRHVLVIKA